MLRLKLLRLSRGLSQFRLAQAVKICQGRYSLLERGLIEPDPKEREALAVALEASPATLFRQVRTPPNYRRTRDGTQHPESPGALQAISRR
jgi:transcriptional regulator with XRE-family HTH domain